MTDIVTSADAAFVSRFDLGGDGARVAVKDSIDIAGFTTRAGSRALAAAAPATQHAVIVQALIEARWHIVGKTNMHELAYGVTGVNAWTGTPRNPRWPDRVPGGSSSGSAVAVAAGVVDAAIGTDTGKSIRVPAACSSIIGLKPTFGRVSRKGVYLRSNTLDCVGPFARTLPLIDQVMAAIDPTYVAVPTPPAVRIGFLDTTAEPAFDAAYSAALGIIAAETWTAFGALIAHEEVRKRFIKEVDRVLQRVDVIALPTLPDFPLLLTAAGDPQQAVRSTALVRQFNLSGHPAITLPTPNFARRHAAFTWRISYVDSCHSA